MTVLALWSENWTAALVNHLWQSTVVVGIAWVLALALRKNPARVRYWVWMAASVKFLLPFSLLMTAGEWLRSLVAAPIVAKPALANVMEQIAQPFPQTQFFDATESPIAAHHGTWLTVVLLAIWACGALAVLLRFGWGWLQVYVAKRVARSINLAAEVPALSSPSLIEPGVFGIFRPVLLLPEGIVNRLTPQQLSAIVAHEMCHVRRRDNLTFAIHMVVEVLFWFHPLVWWVGARLVEEREQACDEAVVQASGVAQTYAEGILNVCKFYVESPLACVAGVTGSDLKKRIARIMAEQVARKLTVGRRVLLGAIGSMAVAAPVMIGLAYTGHGLSQEHAAPQESALIQSPAFDVVSIKPHEDEDMTRMGIWFNTTPDGLSFKGGSLDMLLRRAFDVPRDRLLNEPEWVKSSRFDVEAKVAPEDAPRLQVLTRQQRWAMLIPALEDRCDLKFHRETRELQIYTLVVASGGVKLKETNPADSAAIKPGSTPREQAAPMPMAMSMSDRGMLVKGHDATMESLVEMLSQQIGITVVDNTKLTGKYDYSLSWMPSEDASQLMGLPIPGPPEGGEQSQQHMGPSIFAALEEQLGLKLEVRKGPVDVIVIDQIKQPSPN